jgi:sugar O-acyltransferase (sialic acid O-acetyltransferase NeuD family)
MKPVVIFGTTDFAQVACVYLNEDSPYRVAAFTVHERFITEPKLLGLDVVPFEEVERRFPPDGFAMFVGVGFKRLNRIRSEICLQCKQKGYRLISYVSTKAMHIGGYEIGENTFVFEANVIQPFVRIGSNVIIWCGNHIGHHVTIGDHCFIASHAVIPGHVVIRENCFIGVNATIRDGVTIAPNCIIGAGATILKDTKEGEVYRAVATEPAPYRSDELKNF